MVEEGLRVSGFTRHVYRVIRVHELLTADIDDSSGWIVGLKANAVDRRASVCLGKRPCFPCVAAHLFVTRIHVELIAAELYLKLLRF